jgi:hypothetical protein
VLSSACPQGFTGANPLALIGDALPRGAPEPLNLVPFLLKRNSTPSGPLWIANYLATQPVLPVPDSLTYSVDLAPPSKRR